MSNITKITGDDFKVFVGEDPAWASKLTSPIEVITYCNMVESQITHLSPLLIFSGRSEDGNVASFWKCKNLKVAQGTFKGYVDFSSSGVEKIRNLNITQPNNWGYAAWFRGCNSLKIAEGTYPGFVDFAQSGIKKMSNLTIIQPSKYGNAVSFGACKNLKVLRGHFNGRVLLEESGIETQEKEI